MEAQATDNGHTCILENVNAVLSVRTNKKKNTVSRQSLCLNEMVEGVGGEDVKDS